MATAQTLSLDFPEEPLFFGQGEVKLQSASLAVADADAAAVEDDGVLDDGEAQAGASERPASSLVNAVEALEEAG